MAEIKATTNEKVFPIKAFLGLNQAPDGDTKLKMGEAAVMNNFRITRDRNLQRRPGTKTLVNLNSGAPVKGLWNGYVNGHEYILGACNNTLYRLWDEVNGFQASALGAVSTANDVHIFGFSEEGDNNGVVYILDGEEYRQWDGTTLKMVEGYRPLVRIAIPPNGTQAEDESASLENVNRLCGKRRVWLSPDGTNAAFTIPEAPTSLDYVKDWSTGENIPAQTADDPPVTNWSYSNGVLTFATAPAQAVNSYEVGYTVSTDFRSQVTNMQYAELFSGTQDTRVFLYGDGTNKTIYSGMDYNGKPRADYFPDLYEALVGDSNTPITGMIRHYSSLACFKKDSAWSISASSLTLAEGLNIPAFYVTPINKAIGNAANGQVRLILNSPFTVFGNDLYEWKNSSYYTSNLTRDERQAKRISDRIWVSLKRYKLDRCYCYDDNDAQEYYICYNGSALVYNYAADAWSEYSGFDVSCMVNHHGELYIGSTDGKFKHVSYNYLNDDNDTISAYWESGSMGFNQDYMRKYSAVLWVGIKPEAKSEVLVTAITDKKDSLNEKVVSSNPISFANINFGNWHFNMGGKATMKRLKIKAKKFVFYKLVFKCQPVENELGVLESRNATVVAADIRVRFTGPAK